MSKASPTVSTFSQKHANGSHLRMATRVTFPDGRVVSFTEKLPKSMAVRQATDILTKNPNYKENAR